MMKDLPITQFLHNLSSDSSIPGGGSAAPLIAAVGISSGLMAAKMTLGKKKYASVENEIEDIIAEGEDLKVTFEELIEQDAIDFGPLADVFKMPTATQSQKEQKAAKMEEALEQACNGPTKTMDKTIEALELLERLSKIGNKMLMGDIGIGASSCKSALEGCRLGVLSNTVLMKNTDVKSAIEEEMENTFTYGVEKADRILEEISADMSE